MIQFDDSFFLDAEYLANTPTLSSQGGPANAYPDTGVTVRASVQPSLVTRTEPDGQVTSRVVTRVYLRDDPSTLNDGAGVRTDDAFRLRGRLYQAESPSQQAAWTGDTPVLWSVDCLDVE